MAYFRKRDNGWEYRISYKAPDGSYKQKSKSGYRTKSEAVYAASQAEIELSNGIVKDRNVTLAEYFKEWATIHKQPHVTATTFEKYQFTYNVIKKYFFDARLIDINPTLYQQALNQMADNYVKATIKLINAHIRQSLKVAILEGKLQRDFTTLARVHSSQESKKEQYKFLELETYERLIQDVRPTIHNQSHFFIYLVAKTGLRFSEALGLTLNSINREQLTIDISRTYKVYGSDKGWQPTKNAQSVRKVPIDKETLQAIDQYIEFGYTDNTECRLISNVSNTAVNKVLHKKTGIPFTAHGLRHTYVSYLISRDIDVVAISKLIGHKDATETLKTYTHLFRQKQEKDFQKVRSLFENLGRI